MTSQERRAERVLHYKEYSLREIHAAALVGGYYRLSHNNSHAAVSSHSCGVA
jgi:hypothetical protein